jgi:hypothetical protein
VLQELNAHCEQHTNVDSLTCLIGLTLGTFAIGTCQPARRAMPGCWPRGGSVIRRAKIDWPRKAPPAYDPPGWGNGKCGASGATRGRFPNGGANGARLPALPVSGLWQTIQ